MAPNLTEELLVTEERIAKYHIGDETFALNFAFEKVSDEILEALALLAEETKAHELMMRVQAGEVMNYVENCDSEKRRVGHMMMRNLFGDGEKESEESLKISKMQEKEWEKLDAFIDQIEARGITDIVSIGIGGSYLGAEAMYEALKAFQTTKRRLHFAPNIDPDQLTSIMKDLDLNKTLVLVITKSGGTLEILSNLAFVTTWFEEKGIDPAKHLVAVTGEKSPIDDPSRYLASFYLWDFIGGRYSVTSMVGCVPLALTLGSNVVKEFLRGARSMDIKVREKDVWKNPALMSALLDVWNRNFLGYPTLAVIPYSQALHRLSAHLQQLFMESLGKGVDRQAKFTPYETGQVIWGEPGTNGQHSFFQLIHQGTSIIPVEYLCFQESQYGTDSEHEGTTLQEKLLSNVFAQAYSLATGKKSENPNQFFCGDRPSKIVMSKRLTPFALGEILAYYEALVAFLGFIWNINPFDQEGVQLGKVAANDNISYFKGLREGKDLEAKDRIVAKLYQQLSQLKTKKA